MSSPLVPTAANVQQWLQTGESETVEFLGIIPSALRLSQLIAALANASGGVIVFGVQEHPARVTGISSWPQLNASFDRALLGLTPVPNTILHQVAMPNGKIVGVAEILASTTLVVSPAGAYVRRGESTVAMSPAEVQSKLAPQGQQTPRGIAEQYAALTASIAGLRDELAHSQSWRGQWKGWLISALIGAVLGMPTGFVMSLAASYKYADWTRQVQPAPDSTTPDGKR
jgi:hypothetical protein